MAIRIITDSASDVTAELAKELSITVVPLSIQFGPHTWFDGVSITRADFYDLLLAGEHHPTTAQPSPEAFLHQFEQAKAAGDEVLCVTLSSRLSGTFQSANIAKAMCEYEPIHIVDSLSATGGMQLLLHRACAMRQDGASAADIAAALEQLKGRIRVYAVIDTLEYLHKGGRLSAGAAAVGTAVRLKPIVEVRDGEIRVVSKAFGLAAADKQLLKLITEHPADAAFPVYHLYTDRPVRTESFLAALADKGIVPAELRSVQLGAALGTHIGPGVLAFAYIDAE